MQSGDDQSDNAFVEEHRSLVENLAKRLQAQLDLSCEMDDLVAFGFRGLIEARDRFDAERGAKFQTFAYYRVRGAILDGVRQMAYLPRRVHARLRAAAGADDIAEAVGEARQAQVDHGAGPTAQEARDALNKAVEQITASFMLAAIGQDRDPDPNPEQGMVATQRDERVRRAVMALPERESALMKGVYLQGRSFGSVSDEMGISRSWASRLHARAIELLREELTSVAENG